MIYARQQILVGTLKLEMNLLTRYRLLHHCAAILTSPQIFARVKAFENALELCGDVFEFKVFFV